MAEQGIKVRFHFHTIEELEAFILESQESLPHVKILDQGTSPGYDLNEFWLEISIGAEDPPQDSLSQKIHSAKKRQSAVPHSHKPRNRE